jgi:hypothetical protein
MRLADKILQCVIAELKSRCILDEEAYENCFGCKSWDEVIVGINKVIRGKA